MTNKGKIALAILLIQTLWLLNTLGILKESFLYVITYVAAFISIHVLTSYIIVDLVWNKRVKKLKENNNE